LAYFVDCFDSGGTPTVHFFLNSQTQKRRRENPREAAKPQADHMPDFASHAKPRLAADEFSWRWFNRINPLAVTEHLGSLPHPVANQQTAARAEENE